MSFRVRQVSMLASGSAKGRRILDEVSLNIEPGEVHALLGANGAGKTSLLRLLAGDRRPDQGGIALDDRALTEYDPLALARRRAVLAQGDSLRFALSAAEVVALGRQAMRQPRAEAKRIAALALDAVGLAEFAHQSYLELSGGERARLRLARALAQVWEQFDAPAASQAPRYLLLDEPTAHLDPAHQLRCLGLIRRFADHGGGVLLSLHDPNLALAYADRASLLCAGRLIASGPVSPTLSVVNLEALYQTPVERIERADASPLIVFASAPRARG